MKMTSRSTVMEREATEGVEIARLEELKQLTTEQNMLRESSLHNQSLGSTSMETIKYQGGSPSPRVVFENKELLPLLHYNSVQCGYLRRGSKRAYYAKLRTARIHMDASAKRIRRSLRDEFPNMTNDDSAGSTRQRSEVMSAPYSRGACKGDEAAIVLRWAGTRDAEDKVMDGGDRNRLKGQCIRATGEHEGLRHCGLVGERLGGLPLSACTELYEDDQ
ncbi:hypothetical protein FOZ60_017235 [Perkinsus olseni]|uniref:Uncharacterized protein n=1 Tax=Perkinsus olseni TaxID=32597 RepID=A0A7J6N169_PEROL|nr:hypothetical protein FOZ60_017235 [Perkinsus olseni]